MDHCGWIGWDLCFPSRCALLPNTKQSKILAMLSPLVQPGRRLLRRDLERVIGLLLWFTGAASWLRPWLQEFYRLLYKPSVVTRALSVHQFGELLGCLSDSLLVISPTALSDVHPRWRLHSVNNCVVRCLGDQAIACPRVRSGQISVVFFDYSSEWSQLVVISACEYYNVTCRFNCLPALQRGCLSACRSRSLKHAGPTVVHRPDSRKQSV